MCAGKYKSCNEVAISLVQEKTHKMTIYRKFVTKRYSIEH